MPWGGGGGEGIPDVVQQQAARQRGHGPPPAPADKLLVLDPAASECPMARTSALQCSPVFDDAY